MPISSGIASFPEVARAAPLLQAARAAPLLQAARAAWGLASLTAPRRVAAFVGGGRPDRAMIVVTTALGVRHLAQVGACLAFPVRRTWLVGAIVDGLHAGSMLALMAADRRRRKAALADAAIAVGWGMSWAMVGLAGSAEAPVSPDLAA